MKYAGLNYYRGREDVRASQKENTIAEFFDE